MVLQNDIGNRYSPTTIVAAITTRVNSKHPMPTHLFIFPKCGIAYPSIVLLEQKRVIDKARIMRYLGVLSNEQMRLVDQKLVISLGINKYALYYLVNHKQWN